MSERGPVEGKELIEARLARWQKEWGGRAAELDAPDADARTVAQRMAQVNLLVSLVRAKS